MDLLGMDPAVYRVRIEFDPATAKLPYDDLVIAIGERLGDAARFIDGVSVTEVEYPIATSKAERDRDVLVEAIRSAISATDTGATRLLQHALDKVGAAEGTRS